jgi:glutamate---cysteine ligase / carboxylate-amine ligase
VPERPGWARWNPAAAERPWSVGVEEEVMLLDARTWSLASRIDDVLSMLPPPLAASASAETHACVVELKTAPHATVADAAGELALLRHALDGALRDRLGLRAAVAGMHPLALGSDVALASGPRRREIGATMRALARREPTMALHVHVAVPDGPAAVRALDGLRADLPLVLALSANSPFWRGRDSGFASMRTPVFSAFPRVGIPRRFGRYASYVETVDTMVRSGAVPDPGYLWWDARLQPRLGTVEVRIMDAQTRLADVAALAAVVQCLVRRHAEWETASALAPEVLAENRFLAARDGLGAQLIDDATGGLRPVGHALAVLLDGCRPFAARLDCTAELAAAMALAADPGYARQRRLAARDGLEALPARLSAEFSRAGRSVVAASR